LYSQDEKQSKELEKIHEASNKLGMDCEFTDKIAVKIPFEKALLLENQAQFHPTRYIHALAKEFEKAGGIIIEQCRVTAVDETNPLVITTSKGNIKAQNL